MTLVGEAACIRDHAQRQVRIAHPFLRPFDALHDEPAMRRQPGRLMKRLHKVAARETACARHVGQPDFSVVEVCEQEFLCAFAPDEASRTNAANRWTDGVRASKAAAIRLRFVMKRPGTIRWGHIVDTSPPSYRIATENRMPGVFLCCYPVRHPIDAAPIPRDSTPCKALQSRAGHGRLSTESHGVSPCYERSPSFVSQPTRL